MEVVARKCRGGGIVAVWGLVWASSGVRLVVSTSDFHTLAGCCTFCCLRPGPGDVNIGGRGGWEYTAEYVFVFSHLQMIPAIFVSRVITTQDHSTRNYRSVELIKEWSGRCGHTQTHRGRRGQIFGNRPEVPFGRQNRVRSWCSGCFCVCRTITAQRVLCPEEQVSCRSDCEISQRGPTVECLTYLECECFEQTTTRSSI